MRNVNSSVWLFLSMWAGTRHRFLDVPGCWFFVQHGPVTAFGRRNWQP